jgi:hypothetical protein
MSREQIKTIAVLIDAENANYKTIPGILNQLATYGSVLAKCAYGDWTKPHMANWPVVLERLAIRPEQNFARTSGKNASDIALVIDAMDMFHKERFDAFAIVSSDGDFSGLASRLRRGGAYVFGFGEQKTPVPFRNACDDFVVTDLLVDRPEGGTLQPPQEGSVTLDDVAALLLAAVDAYGDANGWTLASNAGTLIKRQRPDFQPQALGCTRFMDLLNRLGNRFETRKAQRGDGVVDEYRPRAAS